MNFDELMQKIKDHGIKADPKFKPNALEIDVMSQMIERIEAKPKEILKESVKVISNDVPLRSLGVKNDRT